MSFNFHYKTKIVSTGYLRMKLTKNNYETKKTSRVINPAEIASKGRKGRTNKMYLLDASS